MDDSRKKRSSSMETRNTSIPPTAGPLRRVTDFLRRPGVWIPEVLLAGMILLGVAFRFAWGNWSEGANLNPDEMGLTNTLSQLHMPSSIGEYFNTRISPLSTYQRYDTEGAVIGYGPDQGWVWGQWPLIIIRGTAEGLQNLEDFLLPRINDWKASLCKPEENTEASSPQCAPIHYFNFIGYEEIRLLGRALSALADTLSLLVCLAIGLRLYSRRIALLGTALSALAVTQIQYSHFLTVDNFVAFFGVLSIYCVVRVAQKGGCRWSVLFGLFFGMALASKMNLAPIGIMILVAIWVAEHERWLQSEETPLRRIGPALLQLTLAVVVTFLSFRVAQPMSFRAPTGNTTFFTINLNPDWLERMAYAQRVSSGIGVGGYPPAEHWANHPAIVTPFLSIVLWGMGLFLGLAAFGGLLWAGYRLLRGVEWRKHVILVLFTGGMFLFLGTRWVMEMRYFLVLYPLFCLLAAWALMELRAAAAQRGRIWRGLANIIVIAVPVATLVWAWSFTGIYRHENSRLQASRWVYQNFPAAISLELNLPSGEKYIQGIPFYGQTIGENSIQMNFTSNQDGRVENLSLGHVRDLSGATDTKLQASLFSESAGTVPLAEVEFAVPSPGTDPRGPSVSVPLGPVDLKRGERYTLAVKAVNGGDFIVEGATFVYEDWDDPIPQNVDGFDANLMFDRTTIQTIPIMWPDVEDKRTMFVQTLDKADYIIIPSQRRIWSVCRMPAVYPMTMEYYRALFDGRLGFDLVAVFQSPLTIGPLQISDLAGTVSWGKTPELPVFNLNPLAAEESFSVYDHAPVWIFRKRADFSLDRVRSILYAVDISHVVNQDASLPYGPLNGLMLPEDREAEQQAGGTWSEMFSYAWLWNKYPGIAAFLWWLWAVVTGWISLPLVSKVFRGLPDEGYSIAKIAGWLLVTWASWILGSLQIPFVWSTIALVWLALAAVGGILGWRDRERLKESFRRLWKTWLAMEIVFLCFFLFDLLIRFGNSDLWHPSKGGEKPMDFSYLNAVIKSTSFPAYDPWFSGGYLNYYYFGFVLVAIPIKLLGTVPTIAYNLALPLLYGTVGVTTYGVAWNLAEGLRRKGASKVMPWIAGLSAAVMLVVLGNLGEVKLVWDGLVAMSTLSFPHGLFFGLGDLPHVVFGGLRYLLRQARWPFGLDTLYWNASRAIPVPISTTGQPLETGPITEFPFFTFLYADLHAHMMAMPLIILSLAGPAAMVIDPDRLRSWKKAVPLAAFTALAVGSLWATNSWNYPISLAIALIGLALAGWRMLANSTGLWDWRGWIRILLLGGLMAGLSVWLFQPYYQSYGAGYNAVQQWTGSKTPLDAYFMIHGLFLFILITYLIWQTRGWLASVPFSELKKYPELGSILPVSAALLIAGIAVILAMGYPVVALAVPLILWAVILGLRKGLADEHRVVLGLLAASLAITCVVEIVVLKGDLDRMNTVFKFYIQAWLFFAVAAGVALGWLVGELERWKAIFRTVWLGTLSLIVAGGLLYTCAASYAKIVDRMSPNAPRTLDGMAYMEYSSYYDGADQTMAIDMDLSQDYRAIRWMQDNVQGSPVIVEAQIGEYRWGSRFTIYTGLPSVLGWNWHQRQQRGVVNDQRVWDRASDISAFYQTTDLDEARAFLRKYDVKYIIVGQLERAYYPAEGLEKFNTMVGTGELRVAYRDDQTVIYEVVVLQT